MSTEAIRNELIDWISKLEDQGLLGSLLGIKKATQHADWADDLSHEERRSIERGLEDLKHGRVTPSKDFWASHHPRRDEAGTLSPDRHGADQ
jgi:hypothetical protein